MFYLENAGDLEVKLKDIKHLKARRLKLKDRAKFCNFKDDFIYIYKIIELDRAAKLLLISKELKISDAKGILALALIDDLEKVLAPLNELNLKSLFIFPAHFSQKNFMPTSKDLARMQKLLISSSCQCERTDTLELVFLRDLEELLAQAAKEGLEPIAWHAQANIQTAQANIQIAQTATANQIPPNPLFIIGPEAGFAPQELSQIPKTLHLKQAKILRSINAAIAAASILKYHS